MVEESWLDSDDNWLEAAVLSCPACGIRLFCMLHSPMCDDHRLYCERCPHAVEVSFYDPVFMKFVEGLPEGYKWEEMAERLEPLLKPCVCGGKFCGTDRRYCFVCGALVPAAAGKDLAPYGGEDSNREPTEIEQAEFDRFTAEFIRDEDVWLESG